MDVEAKYSDQTRFDRSLGMSSRFAHPDSIDNWRHTRMLDMAIPVYKSNPNSSWLTVGDGRFGSDAAYLLRRGLSTIATSLTDEQLKQAHDLGLIEKYQAENAEKLSLRTGSVDFIMCKESYHHFPRPPSALYEMLRVARIGVVLIEPVDNPRLLNSFRNLVKRIWRGDTQHEFESSGNYLYRTSIREMRKLLLAMGGQAFAYKGFNDFYIPHLADYPAEAWNKGSVTTRIGLLVQDTLSMIGLMGYGLSCVVIFTTSPHADTVSSLEQAGFIVERLPRNPYLT